MTSRQKLLELLQTLPEHRLGEVVDFVESIKEKEEWQQWGAQQFARAYGDDEPDYEIDAPRSTWAAELENLFAEWRADRGAKETRFVADGAIGEKGEWASASPRVLFLLKEPHDRNGVLAACKYDLRELFRRPDEFVQNRKTVERNVGRWAFGIQHSNSETRAEYSAARAGEYESLLQCAVVNIKKTPGEAAAREEALYAAAHEHRDFLVRELEILRPQVIVCGGTMPIMRRILEDLPRKGQGFWHRGTLWIDHWHPAARRSPEESYERLLTYYQGYLRCRPNGWPARAATASHTAEGEK